MLKLGDKNDVVKALQGFLSIPVTGIFDKTTEEYVKIWQRFHFLEADGIVGEKTLKAMKEKGLKIIPIKPSLSDPIRQIIEVNRDKLVARANRNNSVDTYFDPEKHVIVVAIRGKKLDLGQKGENDRRIYDDAHYLTTPQKMLSFDGNTDPNGFRKGSGTGDNKGMACLDEGVWFFGRGPHKGRPAFRQACPFRVIRDGNPPYVDTGYHAINWHDGGESSTSSLGCQTNRPSDFKKILEFMYRELDECDNPRMYLDSKSYGFVRSFPYLLISEKEIRKGNLKL